MWCHGQAYGGQWLKGLLEGYTTRRRAIPISCSSYFIYYAGTDGINRMLISIGYGRSRSTALLQQFCAWVVYGAYSTEVLRAAIQAVPVGQIEQPRPMACRPSCVSGESHFRRCCLTRYRNGQPLAQCDQGIGTNLRCGLHRTCTGNKAGRGCQQTLSDVLCLCAISLPLHYANFEPGSAGSNGA